MKKFAIIGWRKPPRTGLVAIIGGALLGSVAAVAPAQSADLYLRPYTYPYQYTTYGPGYNGYYQRGCYSCGCRPCCNPCCNPCGYRAYVRPAPAPVVERHWDYWERRYWSYPNRYPYYPSGYAGNPYPSGYAGNPYPNGYAGNPYPNGYAGYPDYPYPGGYPAYSGGPRPHLGFGGVQYPPAPVSYEYQAPPGPGYDYEASAPPPAGMPGGYSTASYVE
jgi:hypothetical protein